jgi:hypothetical protein
MSSTDLSFSEKSTALGPSLLITTPNQAHSGLQQKHAKESQEKASVLFSLYLEKWSMRLQGTAVGRFKGTGHSLGKAVAGAMHLCAIQFK